MTVSITQFANDVEHHPITGTCLVRGIEITGLTNTAGEPEVYRVRFDGFYKQPRVSIRMDVLVQRPNGSFASLNENKHYLKIGQIKSILKDEIAQYALDNAAASAQ